jgi:pimeloyl-ACP methyl ester carboxylesterase
MISGLVLSLWRVVSGRLIARLARVTLLLYVGFVVLLYLFQEKGIFPGANTQGQPEAQVRPRADTELLRLETPTGDRIVALFGPALTADAQPDPRAALRPTMIYFYGNGSCLNRVAPEFDRFRRLGLNVLIPEYVGYGMSGGSPSETGCQATAETVYDYLVSARKVDPKSIISAGWSLGGAVAIELASRRHVGALIAFSTFTRAADTARRLLPFVPVALLLRHRFDSVDKIANIRCPALLGHGRRDATIPFSMGKQLAESAGGPVTTIWIDQAAHKHFFEIGGAQIEAAITTFVSEHFRDVP